jgi:hypothetical protein
MNRETRSGIGACLLVLGMSATARGQTGWDVAVMAGVFAGHPQAEEHESRDDWFHTGQGVVTVGRHLTPHLKLELEASATGTATQYLQRFVSVPGYVARYPVGGEAESSVRSLAAAVTWQFFDNEWVHPFVTAGVTADFDRRSARIWEQYYFPADPRVPGNRILVAPQGLEGPRTTTRMRGLIGGGVKVYVTERAFIRTDGRVSIGGRQQNVAFRVGVGIDF